ncbi:MAG: DNA methyltransferase [Gammaproteobacteria bacterium]|nr:DNA methyltransferase [Gammaproteobacteria bacterium]
MTDCNIKNRTIFCHDNLDVLRGINSECIDLVYLDPPFNKNKKFTAPIGSSAEGAEFSDIFRQEDVKAEWLLTIKEDQPELFHYLNGIRGVGNPYNFAYLAYMAIRLIECQRVLNETGSIYLHCDPTMSHYLKAVMDCVFGEKNFRNEVIWKRTSGHSDSKTMGAVHDVILVYAVSELHSCNFQHVPYSAAHIAKRYRHSDADGRQFADDNLTAKGLQGGGYQYEYKGVSSLWRVPLDKMKMLDSENRLYFTKRGGIRIKRYLDEMKGFPVNDLWTDIAPVNSQAKEATKYPTQKPLALLKRIIKASSSEGDIVLDPFCGCATTCVAAEHLNRQWIGVDISIIAYDLVRDRLTDEAADPGHILQFRNKIHLKTGPARRTDLDVDYREQKFVYIISHPAYPGEYKVGIARNVQSRLAAYQTADPDRACKIEYRMETPYFRELEKHIHEVFPNKHEWVQADLKGIKAEMQNYQPEQP